MQIFVLEDDAAIAMGLTYALQQEAMHPFLVMME